MLRHVNCKHDNLLTSKAKGLFLIIINNKYMSVKVEFKRCEHVRVMCPEFLRL